MNRGELWTISGSGYASKPRPALIIQDDRYELDSVTVLMLTSTLRNLPLFRVRIEADQMSGLVRDSDVMIDKITTVKRANARERVGRVSSAQMAEVERMLIPFLGIAG